MAVINKLEKIKQIDYDKTFFSAKDIYMLFIRDTDADCCLKSIDDVYEIMDLGCHLGMFGKNTILNLDRAEKFSLLKNIFL